MVAVGGAAQRLLLGLPLVGEAGLGGTLESGEAADTPILSSPRLGVERAGQLLDRLDAGHESG